MRHLDADYVADLMARLRRIPPDARPRWGDLTRDALIRHLIWTVRHSMGRSRKVPFTGTWLSCRIVRPLFLWGLLPIPRDAALSHRLQARGVRLEDPGDLETLHALLEEYLGLVQADELQPAPHPLLGELGIDGWDRLHVRHFEQHCRQFGV